MTDSDSNFSKHKFFSKNESTNECVVLRQFFRRQILYVIYQPLALMILLSGSYNFNASIWPWNSVVYYFSTCWKLICLLLLYVSSLFRRNRAVCYSGLLRLLTFSLLHVFIIFVGFWLSSCAPLIIIIVIIRAITT